MKTVFKTILLLIILVALLMITYSIITKNDLIISKEKVNSYWLEFLDMKNFKNVLIDNQLESFNSLSKKNDSISFFLKKVSNERYIYQTDSIKLLEYNEYRVNDFLLKNKENATEGMSTFFAKIDSLDNKINTTIDKYNRMVKLFNKHRSTFPNFLIAKKYGLKNLKYYNIYYGKKNKNPKVKTNLEKWVETGDPKYLKE